MGGKMNLYSHVAIPLEQFKGITIHLDEIQISDFDRESIVTINGITYITGSASIFRNGEHILDMEIVGIIKSEWVLPDSNIDRLN